MMKEEVLNSAINRMTEWCDARSKQHQEAQEFYLMMDFNRMSDLLDIRFKRAVAFNPISSYMYCGFKTVSAKEISTSNSYDGCYIYMLVHNNRIIYVGQTNVGYTKRLEVHKRHVVFDYVILINLFRKRHDSRVNKVEQFWIKITSAKLNGFLVPFENQHHGDPCDSNEIMKWAVTHSPYFKDYFL